MAKKKDGQVPNRHLYSRVSYLWQAANYMSQIANASQNKTVRASDEGHALDRGRDNVLQGRESSHETSSSEEHTATDEFRGDSLPHMEECKSDANLCQSRRFVSHLRAVSLKSQIRLSTGMKHSFCSHCESTLTLGTTSTSKIENKSRGRRKPWADVLVVICKLCGTVRRSPIGAKRQPRRKERSTKRVVSLNDHGARPLQILYSKHENEVNRQPRACKVQMKKTND